MNKIIALIVLFSSICSCKAQTLYCYETDMQGNGNVLKIKKQDIFRIPLQYSLDWDVVDCNTIIGNNIFKIARIKEGDLDILYTNNMGSILEVSSNKNDCYFTEVVNENDRFGNTLLKRINYASSKVTEIEISDSLNYSHINISPDGYKLSFLYHENTQSSDSIYYAYCIYDFKNKKLSIIDTALHQNGEWFGGVDDNDLSCWVSNNKLIYYRKDVTSKTGVIYSYDYTSKTKEVFLNFPDESKLCLSYSEGRCFFIHNNNHVFSLDTKGSEKDLYSASNTNYLQPRIIVK